MSEEKPQAVVDAADTQPKAGSEADSARTDDSLESLLAQYDEKTKAVTTPEPRTETQPDIKALTDEVETLKGAVAGVTQVKFKQDMDATIKSIRGDLDPSVFDDGLVEAWLDSQARSDPRLQRAWLQRDNDPKQFERIRGELGKAFHKKFSRLPDPNATEDRAIVAAAVRGASTKAPDDKPPNYSSLSNTEYRKEIQDRYGFDPGV